MDQNRISYTRVILRFIPKKANYMPRHIRTIDNYLLRLAHCLASRTAFTCSSSFKGGKLSDSKRVALSKDIYTALITLVPGKVASVLNKRANITIKKCEVISEIVGGVKCTSVEMSKSILSIYCNNFNNDCSIYLASIIEQVCEDIIKILPNRPFDIDVYQVRNKGILGSINKEIYGLNEAE